MDSVLAVGVKVTCCLHLSEVRPKHSSTALTTTSPTSRAYLSQPDSQPVCSPSWHLHPSAWSWVGVTSE